MKKAILIGAGLWLCTFFSCYTAKKANQQVAKALDKFPTEAAKLIRVQFPCKEGIDSAEYLQSMLEADSIVNALAKQLNDTTGKTPLPHFNIDSVTAEDCSRLLKQTTNYIGQLENKNKILAGTVASLRSKLASVQPVKIYVKDSAGQYLLETKANNALQEVIQWKAKYEAEHSIRQELQAANKGKVKIPWWVLVIIGVGFIIWLYIKIVK